MTLLNMILRLLGGVKKEVDSYYVGKQLVKDIAEQIPQNSSFAVFAEVEISVDGKKQKGLSVDSINHKVSYDDDHKGLFYIVDDSFSFIDMNGDVLFKANAIGTTFSITKGRDVVIMQGSTEYEISDLQSLQAIYKDQPVLPAFVREIDYRDRMGLGEITDALSAIGCQQTQ